MEPDFSGWRLLPSIPGGRNDDLGLTVWIEDRDLVVQTEDGRTSYVPIRVIEFLIAQRTLGRK